MRKQHNEERDFPSGRGTALSVALSASSAWAQKKYDTGATDTEIKVGQTGAILRAYSVYANIGKTQAAYMKMINDQGGINGRKVNLIQYDDAYSPPKTVEQIRKLVEGDEVLLTFQIIGTRPTLPCKSISTAKRCRSCWRRPAPRSSPIRRTSPGPWATTPTSSSRARSTATISSRSIRTPRSASSIRTTISVRTIQGLKAGLGDKAAKMIVAEASYEVSDPTIDSQVLKIKDAGADLFYSASTPKQAAQAIRKIHEINWKPVHILDINASPVSATLKPAGLEASKGVISVATARIRPTRPGRTIRA